MESRKITYVSLFSSGGVGCFGFKQNGFECIATNELLEKRLQVQINNNKCKYDTGYIQGDITLQQTKDKLYDEIEMWKENHNIIEPDVIIATPPCQGMSTANQKKKNEKSRNSLVVESIIITKKILPKFFVFENVRAFLKTICTDIDGIDKSINDVININLGIDYNIQSKVINLKEYGSNSSRTRTLVIGVRRDLQNISPETIFPRKQAAKTLRQLIGDLPPLTTMGEITDDIFHSYRSFNVKMIPWIENLKEGQSAFDNVEPERIPHRIINGVRVLNKSVFGGNYTRTFWDKVSPCILTRNDTLSSQHTVHPSDNRVFSIRELMRMMTVPEIFEWSNIKTVELNKYSESEKRKFLKKEELNIRRCLGESVPTKVFYSIALNIKKYINEHKL
jgi:DNA (cytosine-5)-methyltransferase 1